MTITIRDVWPDRATYTPGESARIKVALSQTSSQPARIDVWAHLTWLHQSIGETHAEVTLDADAENVIALPVALPETSFRGYGVTITVRDGTGEVAARKSTALDVLDSWPQAPRYGFLSEFSPDDSAAEAHVDALSRYHINVAQFYDWMWRHYDLMPPTDEFTDALGRKLSLRTVRAKVAACHRYGIAAYGYAAVYGAEPEYTESHADEVVYDAEGKPYSLADLFYIMNIAPNGTWRARMLATMRDAVRDVPFDGLHLDQYGFPRESVFDADGRPYDFPTDFPSFIDEARTAVQQPGREVGVIFNAVENWPIEQVAATTQDAVYIEVWPPFVGYEHLQSLIHTAKRLAPSKQVILAAYMKPLGEATATTQAAAEAATRFTSAAIWANGGFHLLMGEQNAALHDPYYVTHTVMRPEFAESMRAYYDFVTRYLNVLSDRRLTPILDEPSHNSNVTIEGRRVTTSATAGAVWAVERAMPGYLTVSLINLLAASSTEWNAPAAEPTALAGLTTHMRLTQPATIRGVYAATPDDGNGEMTPLPFSTDQIADGAVEVTFETPSLQYWTLLVVEFEQSQSQHEEENA